MNRAQKDMSVGEPVEEEKPAEEMEKQQAEAGGK